MENCLRDHTLNPEEDGRFLADQKLRIAFLSLWDKAKEADNYDKKMWTNFRNLLHDHGLQV